MRLLPIPKWNSKTDDIDSKDFFRQIQDIERSLLPAGIAFPRLGQIWEATRDCEVYFHVASNAGAPHAAAFLAGTEPAKKSTLVFPLGKARLQQGERVRICHIDHDTKPLHVHFVPLRYKELIDSIVPPELRGTLAHYELNLRTAHTPGSAHDNVGYFHELFRLVEDAA